jgi:hypothetical protein
MSDVKALLDRREFVVGAGAVLAAACLPVAIAGAAANVGAVAPAAKLDDWHVDDMWGVYPRPSEAIGYGRPHGDGALLAGVPPADLAFLA